MSADKNQTKSKKSIGRGGHRPGSGRPRGALTKKTRAIAEAAAADGVTPLEFMLNVMRSEPSAELEPREWLAAVTLRFEAAKAAAPYMHPRLQAIEHTGPEGGPIQTETVQPRPQLTREEWLQLHGLH